MCHKQMGYENGALKTPMLSSESKKLQFYSEFMHWINLKLSNLSVNHLCLINNCDLVHIV